MQIMVHPFYGIKCNFGKIVPIRDILRPMSASQVKCQKVVNAVECWDVWHGRTRQDVALGASFPLMTANLTCYLNSQYQSKF